MRFFFVLSSIPRFGVLCRAQVTSPSMGSRTDCGLNFSSLSLVFSGEYGNVNKDGLTNSTTSDGIWFSCSLTEPSGEYRASSGNKFMDCGSSNEHFSRGDKRKKK